jgi:hypothetical protein
MFNRIKRGFMSKLTREDLIGKKVALSIGEPWDFESTDGRGRLLGVIQAISSPEVKQSWIYIETTKFNIDKIEIGQLIGNNRSRGDDTVQDLLEGKAPSCNFAYKEDGERIDVAKEVNDDWFDSGDNKGWLIGGVKLID